MNAPTLGVMATTYENMVMKEQIDREAKSKVEWGIQQASCKDVMPNGGPIFALDSKEHAKLDSLRSKVADLCDLQPTPAPMVRPPRKVRLLLERVSRVTFLDCCSLRTNMRTISTCRRC